MISDVFRKLLDLSARFYASNAFCDVYCRSRMLAETEFDDSDSVIMVDESEYASPRNAPTQPSARRNTISVVTQPTPTSETTTPEHACSVCGLSFILNHNRLRHEAKHHSRYGAKCSVCGIRSSSLRSRNAHERKAHGYYRPSNCNQLQAAIKLDQVRQCKLHFFNCCSFIDDNSQAVEHRQKL